MRETFEEAYNSFMESIGSICEGGKIVAEALVWFTIPFWVLPYMLIKKLKEETDV